MIIKELSHEVKLVRVISWNANGLPHQQESQAAFHIEKETSVLYIGLTSQTYYMIKFW